jgi:hypothetical protein
LILVTDVRLASLLSAFTGSAPLAALRYQKTQLVRSAQRLFYKLTNTELDDFVDVGIWSGLELYVGIICACLPHFNNLLKPVYVCLGISSGKSSRDSGPSGGAGSSGGSRRPWHRHDPDSPSGARIQAITTVDVKQHRTESQVHLEAADITGIEVEEIELGTKRQGETRGAAWS